MGVKEKARWGLTSASLTCKLEFFLYNLAFFNEEKSFNAEAVKKYADELFEANRISEYFHSIIGEAIQRFTLLSG